MERPGDATARNPAAARPDLVASQPFHVYFGVSFAIVPYFLMYALEPRS
jgi:hypothetical protein